MFRSSGHNHKCVANQHRYGVNRHHVSIARNHNRRCDVSRGRQRASNRLRGKRLRGHNHSRGRLHHHVRSRSKSKGRPSRRSQIARHKANQLRAVAKVKARNPKP